MENEAKRAKVRIIIAFSVLIAVLLIIAAAFCVYRYQHTFSQEKWLSNADGRYMIVADMLEKHPLTGMSEADVIALLGKDASAVGRVGIIVIAIQMLPMLGTLFPVEAALKKNFDKNGVRRQIGL